MIHVCPPQRAPAFVRDSALADPAGWIEVSPETLQHPRYGNVSVWGCLLGAQRQDRGGRAQAGAGRGPQRAGRPRRQGPRALYDGYGSCPLTVERGKILLAEFGYGGKLLPTFPFINATKPSRLAWLLKEKMLPTIYWELMLKGREWLARPTVLPHEPGAHDAQAACDYRAQATPPRVLDAMRAARLIPALTWLRAYDRGALTSDLLAAVIVTIMLIPQSLAYAMLAGLPPYVGLYASILPLVGYALFGSSRALAVGPVAVVSLMTAAGWQDRDARQFGSPRGGDRARRARGSSSWRSGSRASAFSPTS